MDEVNCRIRELYPHLQKHELAEVGENLKRYTAVVLRIFERMNSETGKQTDPLTPDVGTLPCSQSGGSPHNNTA